MTECLLNYSVSENGGKNEGSDRVHVCITKYRKVFKNIYLKII